MNRNGWLGILALSAMALALMPQPAPAQFGGLFGGPEIETISTDKLKALLDKQQRAAADAKAAGQEAPTPDFVVVDVRSDAEVDVSIIPGAITKKQFEADRQQYQGRTVIPYCTVGGRSGAYAKQLAAKGVKVKNYNGSILKWIDAELPLVTLDGKPTNRVHTYSNRYKISSKYEQVTK